MHAICNRKKARLTFIKDVPRTLQAPEEMGAWSRQSLVDYTEARPNTTMHTKGFLSHPKILLEDKDFSKLSYLIKAGGVVSLPTLKKE